jgi:integrase
MKAGKVQSVPLSDAAFETLMSLHTEQTEPGDHIFANAVGRPFCDTGMLRVATQIRPGVTVHGFRSCFRDWSGNCTDFPREVCEECLAHQVGNAVERAYRRGTALDKRQALMEAWASHCIGGIVVPFQKRA